jgi:Ser-tRNA(Ala) deacylase AlaX
MTEIESLPNSSAYFVPDAPRIALPDVLREIEELANSVITADLPFTQMLMSRADAEQKYGQDMYDKRIHGYDAEFMTMAMTILLVEDETAKRDEDDSAGHWNVNCCHNQHFSSTNQLGNIKVLKHNYNASKQELRLHFEVFPTHESTAKRRGQQKKCRPPATEM